MSMFVIGLVVFLGVHMAKIAFAPQREALIAKLGENGWKGVYSLISLLGLVLIVLGWSEAKAAAPVFWQLNMLSHLLWLIMLAAFIFLAASVLPAGYIKAKLKHPMTIAVLAWSFGHLLINGDLASILLFGGFFIWGKMVMISAKKRNFSPPENPHWKWDAISAVIGVLVWAVFISGLHLYLIGVTPY